MEREHKISLLIAAVTALSWARLAINLKVASKFASSGNIVWSAHDGGQHLYDPLFLLSKNNNI